MDSNTSKYFEGIIQQEYYLKLNSSLYFSMDLQ